MICRNCGRDNAGSDTFCAYCGSRLSFNDVQISDKPVPEQLVTIQRNTPSSDKWPKSAIIMLAISAFLSVVFLIVTQKFYEMELSSNSEINSAGIMFFLLPMLLLILVVVTTKRTAAVTVIPYAIVSLLSSVVIVLDIILLKDSVMRWDGFILLFLCFLALSVIYIVCAIKKPRGRLLAALYIAFAAYTVISMLNAFFSSVAMYDYYVREYDRVLGENYHNIESYLEQIEDQLDSIMHTTVLYAGTFLITLFVHIGATINLWSLEKKTALPVIAATDQPFDDGLSETVKADFMPYDKR